MTVIAYRARVLAADSRVTVESEAGGIRYFRCEKLYRRGDAVIATAGDTGSNAFVEWYAEGAKKSERPEILVHGDADFTCLVLTRQGLFEFNKWCTPERVIMPRSAPFYAIGCGAKAALGAMHMGASAVTACRVACRVDPLCDPPIVSMTLGKTGRGTAR